MKDRSDDPSHQELTLYHGATSHSEDNNGSLYFIVKIIFSELKVNVYMNKGTDNYSILSGDLLNK